MSTDDFFSKPSEQSGVKAEIVSAYFRGWANVMVSEAKKRPRPQLGYVDLYSGPGIYENGVKSTPIRILEEAIRDPDLRGLLTLRFNDANAANASALRAAIASTPGVGSLEYRPEVTSDEVTLATAEAFERTRFDPTLFFFDPWGYKGLTLRLIKAAFRGWGCDVIFFFNYNRVNAALNNHLFAEHVNELFGADRAAALRPKLDGLAPADRGELVVDALVDALKEEGGEYTLTFPFFKDSGARMSHHLVFVSKGAKGYEIMKGIMAKRSSAHAGGVPAFHYNPADVRQPSLLDMLDEPIRRLADELTIEFAGRALTVRALIDEHHVGRRYIPANYKAALRILEDAGRARMNPQAESRRRNKGEVTLPDDVAVSFPELRP